MNPASSPGTRRQPPYRGGEGGVVQSERDSDTTVTCHGNLLVEPSALHHAPAAGAGERLYGADAPPPRVHRPITTVFEQHGGDEERKIAAFRVLPVATSLRSTAISVTEVPNMIDTTINAVAYSQLSRTVIVSGRIGAPQLPDLRRFLKAENASNVVLDLTRSTSLTWRSSSSCCDAKCKVLRSSVVPRPYASGWFARGGLSEEDEKYIRCGRRSTRDGCCWDSCQLPWY
jgi:hypothetical protein